MRWTMRRAVCMAAALAVGAASGCSSGGDKPVSPAGKDPEALKKEADTMKKHREREASGK